MKKKMKPLGWPQSNKATMLLRGVWAWDHAFREHPGEHGDSPYKPRRKPGPDLDFSLRENQPC